jgi:hypothetical protein
MRRHHIDWERTKIQVDEYFTKAHEGKVRVTSTLLKYILLWKGDTGFYQGRSVTLKKRNLGAGVYEIWMEETK